MKSQQIVEKENISLICELDDAGGEVKWYKGEEEIVPDKRSVATMLEIRLGKEENFNHVANLVSGW